MRETGHSSKRRRLARQLRLFPRQFWLLVGGTFFYLLVIGLAFPYTAILIKGRLGVSMAVVGAIMGGTALAGLPLQPLAGSLSDRFGRRAVMIVCAACSGIMYSGLAFVHGLVPVCLFVFCDRALGWPLFLTASNAMVADLVRTRLRPEGYSLVRLMIGAGEVVGPLIAALLLAGIVMPIFASSSLDRRAPPAAVAPVKRIGEELMTHYVLPLEMVGVLLTAALLGAVVIAMREEPEVKTQSSPRGPKHAEPNEAMSL